VEQEAKGFQEVGLSGFDRATRYEVRIGASDGRPIVLVIDAKAIQKLGCEFFLS
jgi:RNA:NAD 2'-phosphotransferase (TPT1/KptA family)